GVEAALDAFECAEIAFKIGDCFATLEAFEKASLGKDNERFVTSGEMHLAFEADGLGKLAELLNNPVVRVMVRVKAAKSGATGGKSQPTFGSGLGENFQSFVVGIFFASFEDELLILVGEEFEFVHAFHMFGFFLFAGGIGRKTGRRTRVRDLTVRTQSDRA